MCRWALAVVVLLVFMNPALAKSNYYVTKDYEGCQVSEVNEWLLEEAQENYLKIIGNGFETEKGAEKAMWRMEDCRTTN
jgi:hypothetical protein